MRPWGGTVRPWRHAQPREDRGSATAANDHENPTSGATPAKSPQGRQRRPPAKVDGVEWGRPTVPWDRKTPDRWKQEVDARPWERRRTDWVKEMPCPRCTHEVGWLVSGGIEGVKAEMTMFAECNCDTPDETHKGRPKDQRGCGQSAYIGMP